MKSTKVLLALLTALALLFSSCGAEDTVTEVAEDAADVAEDAADATEEAAGDVADAAEDAAADAADAAGDVADDVEDMVTEGEMIEVELNEWELIMPASVPTGPVTYVVSNTGDFNHRLAVVEGTSYEELPLLDNGAIDTDALGEAFIGEQDVNLESGQSGEITWDLPAGDYVFFCPIAVGPNSHAAAGQVLSVTVG